MSIADLDEDGQQDLAVLQSWKSHAGVLFGNGDGTFQPPIQFGAARGVPRALVTDDFNGDLRNGRTFSLQWGTSGKYVLIGLLVALNVGFFISAITHLV